MKRIRKMAGATRNRLWRRSVQHETQRLDPAVRAALVDDVATATQPNDGGHTSLPQQLQALEDEMEQARAALRAAEEKERFLGQRSRHYRKVLDARAQQLKEEQQQWQQQQQQNHDDDNDNDDENPTQAALQQHLEQWERDEDALQSVMQTHQQILADCEIMRWKLRDLETKRQACRAMLDDCHDFLDAAAAVVQQQQQVDAPHDDDDDEAALLGDGKNEPTVPAAAADDEEKDTPKEFDPMIQIIINPDKEEAGVELDKPDDSNV